MTDLPIQARRRVPYPSIDGDKLWELRRAKGMRLKELGAKSGNSVSFLCDLEQGRRNVHPDRLQRIAQALGCTPADLRTQQPA